MTVLCDHSTSCDESTLVKAKARIIQEKQIFLIELDTIAYR